MIDPPYIPGKEKNKLGKNYFVKGDAGTKTTFLSPILKG